MKNPQSELFCGPIDAYHKMYEEAVKVVPYYGDILVCIELDGREENHLLLLDGTEMMYEWETDWYEGEKSVKFIGAVLIDDIDIRQILKGAHE